MEMSTGKVFEKPPAGLAIGTIIDIVDMPNIPSVYDGVSRLVNKVRLLWVLNKLDGTPMVDKEGKQLTVAYIKPANMSVKADLYKMVTMLLSAAPPVITKTEDLDPLLLGRSNVLFITLTPNDKQPGDFYANVTGASPLAAGMVAPVAPQGFVREKNKPKQVAGVATYATPQAAAQAVAQQAVQPAAAATQPANVATPGAPATPAPGAPPNNVSF